MSEELNNVETPQEQSQQDLTKPIVDQGAIHEREKAAFVKHVETSQDETVPENFADAGAWFESLKSAQKKMTQTSQEVAELRKQLEQKEQPAEVAQTEEAEGFLRIEKEKAEQKPEADSPKPIDEATYEQWYAEFAVSGEFSESTRNEIKTRTGFTDNMLDDYMKGQKARLADSYNKASGMVGGKEKLAAMFKWAASNMSDDDLQAVNLGLASSSYEVTLRGLAAMYDAATVGKKAKEPERNPNLVPVSSTQQPVVAYQTQREFKADRNDPRFNMEEKFREHVQARMSMTDWNQLPL